MAPAPLKTNIPSSNEESASAIIAAVKTHPGLVVLRDWVDPGCECFWLLDMTAPEFEGWWQEREEFWWPVTPEAQELFRIYGEPPPPLRPAMELPGRFLSAHSENRDDHKLLMQFWLSLYESRRHHHCQICCENDSFLDTRRPSPPSQGIRGKLILGWVPPEPLRIPGRRDED